MQPQSLAKVHAKNVKKSLVRIFPGKKTSKLQAMLRLKQHIKSLSTDWSK